MRRRRAPGGRCRSYLDPTLGLTIDNGNHLLLSGNHAALDYLDRIGARETLHDPGAAIFDFADLTSGERWRLRLERGPRPVVAVRSAEARARNGAFGEYFAPLGVFLKGQGATVGEAMRCEGAALRAALASAADLRAQHRSAGKLRRAHGGSAARDAGGGRKGLPSAVRRPWACEELHRSGARLSRRARSPVRFGDRLRAIRFEGEPRRRARFRRRRAGARSRRFRRSSPSRHGSRRTCCPASTTPDEFRGILNVHFRVAPPPDQPAILGVVNGADRMVVRLSGPALRHDQQRRPADRPSARSACGRNLARGGGADRTARRSAAVADRQGEARDIRRDAGAGRKAAACEHPMGQCCPRRRLDRTGLPATIEGAVRSGYKAASIILERGRGDAEDRRAMSCFA